MALKDIIEKEGKPYFVVDKIISEELETNFDEITAKFDEICRNIEKDLENINSLQDQIDDNVANKVIIDKYLKSKENNQ